MLKNLRRCGASGVSQPNYDFLSEFAKLAWYASLILMKAPLFLASLITFTALIASGQSIEIGQTEENVIEILGKPVGTIALRDKTLLLYPQGEVTLKEDKVSHIDLMDAEEFAADQERLKEEREQWLVDQERMDAMHKEEGQAIRADKLKSQAFAALPAKDRVDYWRGFQVRYPTVDVSEQIGVALASYEVELQELRNQQKVAELEVRVAKAEQEAANARLETEKLREETERTKNSSRYYGLRYYTDPVVDRRYYYRPPTITIYSPNGNKVNNRTNNITCPTTETVSERATRILK